MRCSWIYSILIGNTLPTASLSGTINTNGSSSSMYAEDGVASSTRLDLCLFVSTSNPESMIMIFSPQLLPLPIAINHHYLPVVTASHVKVKKFRCMQAALKRYNRVRGITFSGTAPDFDELFKATKCPFPMLEDLELRNFDGGIAELKVPATFLDGSAPHLRRLKLYRISLTSISSLLSSTTTLFELCLRIYTTSASLLAHLRDMHCLRHLNLWPRTRGAPSSIDDLPANAENTFLLSKLTSFHYQGPSLVLSALVAGSTAPSLQVFTLYSTVMMRAPFFTSLGFLMT